MEGEPQGPRLEISQDELTSFQNKAKDLAGKMKQSHGFTTASQRYLITEDGQPKTGQVRYSEFEDPRSENPRPAAILQIIDTTTAEGTENSHLYWEIAVQQLLDGKNHVILTEGAMEEDKFGIQSDPARKFDSPEKFLRMAKGAILRKNLDGEPIDEFRKAQDILDQIKREQDAAQARTLRGRVKSMAGKLRRTSPVDTET
jgi:hypothetical protein